MGKKKMLPEYLDLEQIIKTEALKRYLTRFPHIIQNNWGQIVSEYESKHVDKNNPRNVVAKGKVYGQISANLENIDFLQVVLTSELNDQIQKIQRDHLTDLEYNLAKDIDQVVNIGLKASTTIEESLKHFFHCLRSYVPFQNCSVYLESPDKKLIGIAGLTKEGKFFKMLPDAKPLDLDTLAGLAFTTQKVFITENPTQDKEFKKLDHQDETPLNLAVFPLNYNNYGLGILNLTNNMQKKYTEQHISIISRFCVALNHILFQKQIKQYIGKSYKLKNDLRYYVSNSLFDSLKEGGGEINDQTEKRNVTCLFCDIRSFTSISELLDPEELVRLLNLYFDQLAPIIEENNGTIDKFVGDMIAAFWNAPKKVESPEVLAVQTAIRMQKAMVNRVVPEWAKAGVAHVGIGIGIHSGDAIVGNIGAKSFNNYTVLGNVARKANWLESLARPAEIWVSESTYNKAKERLPRPQRKERNKIYKGKKNDPVVYKPENYIDYTRKK